MFFGGWGGWEGCHASSLVGGEESNTFLDIFTKGQSKMFYPNFQADLKKKYIYHIKSVLYTRFHVVYKNLILTGRWGQILFNLWGGVRNISGWVQNVFWCWSGKIATPLPTCNLWTLPKLSRTSIYHRSPSATHQGVMVFCYCWQILHRQQIFCLTNMCRNS